MEHLKTQKFTLVLVLTLFILCIILNAFALGQVYARLTAQSKNSGSFSTIAVKAPTNLQGTNALSIITLTWTASPNVTQYNVYYLNNGANSTCPTSGYSLAAGMPITGTTYSELQVIALLTYYCYQVQAVAGTWTSTNNPSVAIKGVLTLSQANTRKGIPTPEGTISPTAAISPTVTVSPTTTANVSPTVTNTPDSTPDSTKEDTTTPGGTAEITTTPSASLTPEASASPTVTATPDETSIATVTPIPSEPPDNGEATPSSENQTRTTPETGVGIDPIPTATVLVIPIATRSSSPTPTVVVAPTPTPSVES